MVTKTLPDVQESHIVREESRQQIADFDKWLLSQPNVKLGNNTLTPIKHLFGSGTYVREMFVPKGVTFTGKIHNMDHIIIIAKGTIKVFNETMSEVQTLTGPCIFEQERGIKRVGLAVTDVYWYNIHSNPSETRDIDKIEHRLVSKTFEEYKRLPLTKKLLKLWRLLQRH